MKTEEKVVYPAVRNDIVADSNGKVSISFHTNLRKKGDDGLWYLWEINMKFNLCDCFDVTKSLVNAANNFHNNIYRTMLLGKVDMRIVHYDSKRPVFTLDDNQVDEKERMAM